MRRNCNLELRLFPKDSDHRLRPMEEEEEEEEEEGGCEISPLQHHQQPQPQQQPLTIFYDGKICVCDVTEFQARSILMLANKERRSTPNGSEPCSPLVLQSPQHNNTNLHSPVPAPAGTSSSHLSMKRSLQRFLQKRKTRVQEASPYTTTKTYMT